jgi:hypothetical protein
MNILQNFCELIPYHKEKKIDVTILPKKQKPEIPILEFGMEDKK